MLKSSALSRFSLEATSIIFGCVVTVLFGISLLIVADDRTQEFINYHTSISTDATSSIGNEIERILKQKKRLVSSFLGDNRELISNVVSNPGNENLYAQLNTKLGRYFSDYFASNITTDTGKLVADDFDGKIGQICIEDTRDYIRSGAQRIRVHPNPVVYHYDILANFDVGEKDYIFLVSFNTSEISSLLKTSMPDKHNLMLINNQLDIIEVLPAGNRINIPNRLDYSLTDDERNRILTSFPIKGTYWDVVDIRNKGLFKGYRAQLIKQGVIIYSFFIVLTVLMSIALYIGIKRKNALQTYLLKQNKKIVKLNKDLETLSLTDSLTGLYNRRYLDIKGSSEFNTARRLNIPLSIAMTDIDYFKPYNDTYGHQAGDECIIKCTQLLAISFRRSNELVARYGGEEFLIMNLGDETSNFISRLESLRQAIEATRMEHSGSKISNHVTISIGVASLPDPDCHNLYELTRKADAALYLAKEQGRNRLVMVLAKNSQSSD